MKPSHLPEMKVMSVMELAHRVKRLKESHGNFDRPPFWVKKGTSYFWLACVLVRVVFFFFL